MPRLVGLASGNRPRAWTGNRKSTTATPGEPDLTGGRNRAEQDSRQDIAGQAGRVSSLNDIYVLVHAALENETVLEQYMIMSNSADTILCIQVRYSVTDLEAAAKIVYRLRSSRVGS